jgi:hypothetical protein
VRLAEGRRAFFHRQHLGDRTRARGAAERTPRSIRNLGLNRCQPCAPSWRRYGIPSWRDGEQADMSNDDDDRPVADRRRGSRRDEHKGGRLHWLCNPLVLKAVIALARFGYALAHIVLRH